MRRQQLGIVRWPPKSGLSTDSDFRGDRRFRRMSRSWLRVGKTGVQVRRGVLTSLGVLAAVCALGTGCVPSAAPVPSPSPPSPAPPSASPVPTPTENAQEREERIAYEQAEAAYRAFGAEYDRLAEAGGALMPTATMRRYAGGPFLKAYARVLRQQKEIGARARGRVRVAYVKPAGYSPTSLLLSTCEDGSGIRIFDARGKPLGSGAIAQAQVTVRKQTGAWLLWQSTEKKVDSC